MKIYILGQDDYDGMDISGVYSSKEKAMESLPYFNLQEDDIKEFEIDLPNTGEKYEEFYYYNIFADGKEEHGKTTRKPSQIEPFHYGQWNRIGCIFQGTGKTLEEAKANCYKARDNAHPVWQIGDNGVEVHHADISGLYDWGKANGFYSVHEDRNVCIIALEEYKKTGKVSEFLTFSSKD